MERRYTVRKTTTTKLGLLSHVAALVPLAVLGAVIVACSSSSGSSGTKPTASDAGVCGGFASPDAQCNTCLTTSCCTEGTACGANAACETIYLCVEACSDDMCSQGCLAANPSGADAFNSLTGCVTNACGSACSGATGDDGGTCGGFTFSTDPCQTCFQSSCCSQGTACAANTDCTDLDSCIGSCGAGDTACESACASAHPTGNTLLGALSNCLSGPCASACGFSTSDSGLQCGGFTSTDACQNTCLTSTCCSQAESCAENASCLAIFSCVDACSPTDSACADACGTANASGVATFNALATCQGSCPCGGADAGGVDAASPDGG